MTKSVSQPPSGDRNHQSRKQETQDNFFAPPSVLPKNSEILPAQKSRQESKGEIPSPKSSFSVQRLLDNSALPETPSSSQLHPTLQAKLEIGAAGDRYEQEADRVARDVVQCLHSPEKKNPYREAGLQQEQGMRENLQRQVLQQKGMLEGREAPQELEAGINRERRGGQPLDATVQRQMGEAMGMDFSGVRVHTNAKANQLNESIQAKAFTTGRDVFFKRGAYQPSSTGGQELIAHELTHVAQQGGDNIQRVDTIQRTLLNPTDNQSIVKPKKPKEGDEKTYDLEAKDDYGEALRIYKEKNALFSNGMSSFRKELRAKMMADQTLKNQILQGIDLANDESAEKKIFKNVVSTLSHDAMIEYNSHDASWTVDNVLTEIKKETSAQGNLNEPATREPEVLDGYAEQPALDLAKTMAVSVASVDSFEKFVNNMAGKVNVSRVELRPFPSVKSMQRAAFKTVVKYNNNTSNLTDVCAASLVFDNAVDLYNAAVILKNHFQDQNNGGVVFIKNRFKGLAKQLDKNTEDPNQDLDTVGYSDMLWNIQLSSGYIAEVQLHLDSLKDKKDTEGHKLYKVQRELDEGAKFIENDKIEAWQKVADEIDNLVTDEVDSDVKQNRQKQILKLASGQGFKKALKTAMLGEGDFSSTELEAYEKALNDPSKLQKLIESVQTFVGNKKELRDTLAAVGNQIYTQTLIDLRSTYTEDVKQRLVDENGEAGNLTDLTYEGFIKKLGNFNWKADRQAAAANSNDMSRLYYKFFNVNVNNHSQLLKAHKKYYFDAVQEAKAVKTLLPRNIQDMEQRLEKEALGFKAIKEKLGISESDEIATETNASDSQMNDTNNLNEPNNDENDNSNNNQYQAQSQMLGLGVSRGTRSRNKNNLKQKYKEREPNKKRKKKIKVDSDSTDPEKG